MTRAYLLVFLLAAFAQAETPVHEMVYAGALWTGGQVVPMYDKGYLFYLHDPSRLEAYRPDGTLAFNADLPCPGSGACAVDAVAVDSRGRIAVSFGYTTQKGYAAGIRILDSKGAEVRFIETPEYLPTSLCFDRDDNLWSLGWQRGPGTGGFEDTQDYPMARRFSPEGKEIGRYLPRSLWRNKKSQPGRARVGYWTMYAASDRIGAMIHENHADNPTEWIEWDLNGNLLSRTVISGRMSGGRAFTSDGRLYARFQGGGQPGLRVLDTATGKWTPISANLPENAKSEGIFLLGADGKELVYRVGYGNMHLVWARPGP